MKTPLIEVSFKRAGYIGDPRCGGTREIDRRSARKNVGDPLPPLALSLTPPLQSAPHKTLDLAVLRGNRSHCAGIVRDFPFFPASQPVIAR